MRDDADSERPVGATRPMAAGLQGDDGPLLRAGPPPSPWVARLSGIAGGLVASGLLLVVIFVSGAFGPRKPAHPLCPECPGETPIRPALDAVRRAGDTAAQIDALESAYAIADDPRKHARELACLARLRDKVLDALESEALARQGGRPAAGEDPGSEVLAIDLLLDQGDRLVRLGASPPSWIESMRLAREVIAGPRPRDAPPPPVEIE